MKTQTGILAGLSIAVAALSFAPAQAEIRIKTYSSMSKNLLYTKLYLEHFVKPANAAGKGIFKLAFIGGPEVTPARKSAQALQRGTFDIIYGPAGYYTGDVPEALALHGRSVSVDALLKNGGIKLIDKIWGERVGATVLAWGIADTGYTLVLHRKTKAEGWQCRSDRHENARVSDLQATD